MGRFEEARGPLEQAAREMPMDPTVLEHLGDLYLRLGERASALEAWSKALGVGPEDPGALRSKIERERAHDEVNRTYPESAEGDPEVEVRLGASSLQPPP